MNANKFDKLAEKLNGELIKSGLKPHVQLIAKDFAASMANKTDTASNARGFDILRTVFQSVHDTADRHTALRTLVQMIDAIDAHPNRLTFPPARKLAVAHFETILHHEDPLPMKQELAMGVQLFTRVAAAKYTKLTLATHLKDAAHHALTELPQESSNALETVRDFLITHEAEERKKRPVLTLRPRHKFVEPVSAPVPDNP